MNKLLVILLIAVTILLCSACGSRQPSKSFGNDDAVGTPGVGISPISVGLPALAALPEPKEALSLSAPGFLTIDHLATVASANAVDGGGFLTLDNATNILTFAMYGVYGFDGDNYPVSVRLNVGDASGNFYVAFSNYISGVWQVSGPFNADGEFGIPQLDEYTDQNAFISPDRYHYFAVIAANGSLVHIDGVQLGVSGGDNAPQAVFMVEGKGGANGLYLNWFESASYQDPDFAGYIVERAPQFGGEFTPLSGSPSLVAYFHDASAVIDTKYRYRVVAFDTSGNHATGPEVEIGAETGNEAEPVPVVQVPSGPLVGPASIVVDMSDSFDPEGEGIVTHTVSYISTSGETTAFGPVAGMTLQPGCYVLTCEVECADGRNGRTHRLLKVYPQWEATSTLVRATEPTLTWKEARLDPYKGALQPSDERMTIAGYDATVPGLVFHHYDGAGAFDVYRAPQIEEVQGMGEPIEYNGVLLFPFCNEYEFLAAGFDGTNVTLSSIADMTNSRGIAFVQDNSGIVWAVYGVESGIDTKIRVDGEIAGLGYFDVATVAPAADQLDMELDPASGRLLVFYQNALGLQVGDVDQVGEASMGDTLIGAGVVDFVDAEVNPENNRVAVLFNIGNAHYYREQDGMGGWTPAVQVDNSLPNNADADLEPSAAGQLNAYFSLNSGQAHRYIYSSGVWSNVNTSSFSADSGYQVSLLPIPGSPDMRVADVSSDGEIRIARMNDNGTDNNFVNINSAMGQGFDMHGAGGSDGLHLIWSRVFDYGTTTHSMSASGPNEGDAWLDEPTFNATAGLNLLASYSGEVYATGFDALAATLYWWDPMAVSFNNDAAFAAQSLHRPMLSKDSLGSNIYFGVWDQAGGTYHLIEGAHGSYGADAPYLPDPTPIWNAVFDSNPTLPGLICIAGPNQAKPLIGWNPPGSDYFDLYSMVNLDDARGAYDKRSIAGRTIGTTLSFGNVFQFDAISSVTVTSLGSWFHPVRFTRPMFGATSTFTYPIGQYSEYSDSRNTVSVSTGNSLTAVNLVASLDGQQACFEWSSFGTWEQLDLPHGLDNLTAPLIVIGYDGRWHLVYRDWKNDAIMCRSTL